MKNMELKTWISIGKSMIAILVIWFIVSNIIDFIQALSLSTLIILAGLWFCRSIITGIIKVLWFLFKIYVFIKIISLFII